MKPSITLGRLFGVDIGLHYSWFFIALLITPSLVGHFGGWRRRVLLAPVWVCSWDHHRGGIAAGPATFTT